MVYDVMITWPTSSRVLKLKMTGRKMDSHGQHGQATILVDDFGDSWLLKVFGRIIDTETSELSLLDVDVESSPDEMKDRLHLWRSLNELTASRLAAKLELTVPEAIIITSAKISSFVLEPDTELSLPANVIILDDESGGPETAEEFYGIIKRENYIIETSDAFENFLAGFNGENDPCFSLGVLVKYVPGSIDLDSFLDSRDFDEARNSISNLTSSFRLLPFDVWLNDPDRNQGNYLIKMDDNDNPADVYGLDYEMWSFASDIWMDQDEITRGRSYLTAVIHDRCDVLDSRIVETVFRISAISDRELVSMTYAPKALCQFMEYHVSKSSLDHDERLKLLNIEQNLFDFLHETKPKLDKLTIRIIRQIGLPARLKELEQAILVGLEDELDDDE